LGMGALYIVYIIINQGTARAVVAVERAAFPGRPVFNVVCNRRVSV
jgi:hypothetical protein